MHGEEYRNQDLVRHPFPKLQLKTSTSLLLLTAANRLARHFVKVAKDMDALTGMSIFSKPINSITMIVMSSWNDASVSAS